MSESLPSVLPIFPLPEMVLFPAVQMPLHIFEPRYREMLEAALAGDRLIVLALLKPGWEEEYYGAPAVYPVACAGRVVAAQKLPDGRSYITLAGVSRVRIVAEVPGLAYRRARVEALADRREWLATPAAAEAVPGLLPAYHAIQPEHRATLGADWKPDAAALEVIVNTMAMYFPGEGKQRQQLLEIDDLAERFQRLAELVREATGRRELLVRWQGMKPDNPELN